MLHFFGTKFTILKHKRWQQNDIRFEHVFGSLQFTECSGILSLGCRKQGNEKPAYIESNGFHTNSRMSKNGRKEATATSAMIPFPSMELAIGLAMGRAVGPAMGLAVGELPIGFAVGFSVGKAVVVRTDALGLMQ
mmetsp:Transcript_40426/g.41076  ORF Transcript_40426/g.41076 Transcript_40426/m.41076 type:complete len:135 (+) Transcript_40426:51-455(+)